MSLQEVILEGTLKADGSLELDHKPKLAPGRVQVVLRQESGPAVPPQEDWFQHLQRIRALREASHYPFMDEGETNTYIDLLREGDRIDDMLGEADEQSRKSEKP